LVGATLWARAPGGAWASTGLTQTGTSGAFDYAPTGGEGTYYFATVATDNAGNAQPTPSENGDGGTLYDVTPPVVSLTVQRALRSGVVTLTWAVTETGSGVPGYNVDVSVGGGAFAPWRSNITQTSAVYTGERGQVCLFRVTAVDRANNAGSAEATARAETVRKYSAAAGRRVAMRENSVVYYLHGDHLGSTSLVTCGSAGGCNGTPYQDVVSR